MFDGQAVGIIKNEKIMRCRLEFAGLKYDIIFRPGKENMVADTLSRVCATTDLSTGSIKELHEILCDPGITRMLHWTRSKSLPFSVADIRNVINSCKVCSEVEPKFVKQKGIFPRVKQYAWRRSPSPEGKK